MIAESAGVSPGPTAAVLHAASSLAFSLVVLESSVLSDPAKKPLEDIFLIFLSHKYSQCSFRFVYRHLSIEHCLFTYFCGARDGTRDFVGTRQGCIAELYPQAEHLSFCNFFLIEPYLSIAVNSTVSNVKLSESLSALVLGTVVSPW